jgi:hypothetical protein
MTPSSFQNPESLIDIVIANECLHMPSISYCCPLSSALGEAPSDTSRPSVEDMIDDMGEYYRRENIWQRRADL